ncbi:P-loop ATPase, Sll1717 family [Nitrospirillum amazonense]|uniref:P-loop ATPase, Sll1717 family n=1 Tax=Nitrospirillum amazonense TaxID=28077 RepID=UPI0024125DB2|nr:hypothetical protein [Nitrospirillum amazonense]MDG3439789.1 hypothetical protein [Nitrospirillum amazonense]
MVLALRKLQVGKVDGKHEYLTPINERDSTIFDAFLIPEIVEPDRMHNGDVFFVEGFRGTGKTSLLRWHAESVRRKGCVTDFVLFKTDLTESQRMHISKEVGVSWSDIDAKSMEISQDFKASWTWFVLHKIGENIKNFPDIYEYGSAGSISKVVQLLGLDDDSILKKAIGFMPKLDGAHVKVRGNAGFFEAELGADFKRSGDGGEVSLDSLNKKIEKNLSKINFVKPIYIYFDELEAFYHTKEQHKRDQRMVRDLIFSISNLNNVFRSSKLPLHILAAVRSEVIDTMGSLGQEVDRLVHDRGFLISWHHSNRSLYHPLMQMIAKKITASEKAAGVEVSADALQSYFVPQVNGESIDAFLLDRSFYKPRDIVWRLTIAQRLFPNEILFSDKVLRDTEIEYSSKLWDEVRYELSAIYSDVEVDLLEDVFSGGSASFEFSQIENRFFEKARLSSALAALIGKRSVREILSDFYRIGAIGNSFRAGSTGTDMRNRWSFRGDPTLLVDKRMVIHPALLKRLSAVSTRRRGVRGGASSQRLK